MGKINVKIRFKNGTNVTIADVFFVSDLFWNLLSMRQLTEKKKKKHLTTISNGVCTIGDKNKIMIAKVQMTKNKVFPIFLQVETLFSLNAIVENNNWF